MGNLRTYLLGTLLLTGVTAKAGDQLLFKAETINTKDRVQSAFRSLSMQETKYLVVQFKNPIELNDQQWLKSLDVEVLRYVPEDAYLVRANNSKNLGALKASEKIQAVMAYQPEFRMNERAHFLSVFNQSKVDKMHIRFFKGVDMELAKQDLAQIPQLKLVEQIGTAAVVEIPMSRIKQLASIEGVEWVDLFKPMQMHHLMANELMGELDNGDGEEDGGFMFNKPAENRVEDLTGFETGTRVMNFSPAWNKNLTGKGQIIAVADSGLDTGDEATLSRDFKNLVKVYIGGMDSVTWGDLSGHGTHVAGSVLNSGENTNGKIRGGAYEAGLVMEAMYSEPHDMLTIGVDPTPLFEAAYGDGARIHTNSWGNPYAQGTYDDAARAVDEYMFNNQDMLLLFAAGNDGVDSDANGRIDSGSVSSPATAKNALSVGASENLTEVGGIQAPLGYLGSEEDGFRWPAPPLSEDTLSNNPNGIAAFSSRGPALDGRTKPDVVAPGTNVLSNCSHFPQAGKLWGPFNEDYCFAGGTSMSTPLVAGAAALVRQNLQENMGVPSPSAALIKGILMHTATDLYPGQFGAIGEANGQELLTPGPNSNQGYGRVNVAKATEKLSVVDEKVGLATAEEKTFDLPRNTRKVTLVYADAPGSTAAEKSLVNNLDIEVHTASGKFFTSNSSLNNSEQIMIPPGETQLKLIVKGKSVPMGLEGKQPYSLIYSQ